MQKRILIVLVISCFNSPVLIAESNVYRCVADNGDISFQQAACKSSDAKLIVVDSPLTGWQALRKGEAKLYKDYRRRDKKRIKKNLRLRGKKAKKKTESSGCWRKKRKLIALNKKLRQGYRRSTGEVLRQKRSDTEDYIAKFCG